MHQTRLIIGCGSRKKVSQIAAELARCTAILVDHRVKRIATAMRGTRDIVIEITAGESSKTLSCVERICSSLVRKKVRRDSVIIGVGGGVIGDLAGFIASIYMRGVPTVLVPTTLLAMADACIGGKTGVNLPEGKNLIGTFRNPSAVIIDPEVLSTLPDRIFREGFAEIIKHAVIADPALFKFLEKNSEELLRRNMKLLDQVIQKSLRIKQKIVAADPRESLDGSRNQSRMYLNYGHTIGHALEQHSDFRMLHGEAVAIGMIAENEIAVERGLLSKNEADRIKKLVAQFQLPTALPVSIKKLATAVHRDKKTINGKVLMAIPQHIGRMTISVLLWPSATLIS